MPNSNPLADIPKEVFNNTWEKTYAEIFDVTEIKEKIFDNTVMQVIVWNHKYENFYPSYPIYLTTESSQIQEDKIRDYKEYIRGNYDSFSFSKFIKKNNIKKEIRLLPHSNKTVEYDDISVTIPIKTDIDIGALVQQIYNIFELKVENYPSTQDMSLYLDKLDKLLDKFNFKTIIIEPILSHKDRVIGVISIYSEIEDYQQKEIQELNALISTKITKLTKSISRAKREEKKRKEIKKKLLIKNTISSIMSRNISHNIGSHVLVNVESNMENTPIIEHKKLINYILERMNFITQVSTLWSPKWSLPRFFKKEIIEQFLEQKHILYNIVTTDGLAYKEDSKERYYIISKDKASDSKHNFQIIGGIKSTDKIKNSSDRQDDILVDIPGGKIGYHAIYTIIENILRNSAKYGYATLSRRYQKNSMKLNITIDKTSNHHQHTVQIWDNVSYISNLENSFDIRNVKNIKLIGEIEELKDEPFIKIKLQIEKDIVSIFVHKRENSPNSIKLISPTDKFDYEKKIKEKNSFFLSEARFHSILRNLGDNKRDSSIYKRANNILTKRENLLPFIKLLNKRVFNPLHKTINGFFKKSIIDNEKDLNENNGLSEIKICALYLSGLSGKNYEDLAKNYNKDREYIKAIAKRDVDKDGNLLCYRLGYEFLLNKPTVFSLSLTSEFREKLSFIEQCTDESFVLIDSKEEIKTSLRTSPKIVSSEFLICDIEKFKNKIKRDNFQDELNKLPYRIIVLTDGKDETIKNFNRQFVQKRVALLDISECKNRDKSDDRRKDIFKEKILNTWIQHTLKVNRHNKINATINLNGSQNRRTTHNTKDMATSLLEKFTNKLVDDNYVSKSKKEEILKTINLEYENILENTSFQHLFKMDENRIEEKNQLKETTFSCELEVSNPEFNEKTILLSRHTESKDRAKQESKIETPLVYYESLSGGTNQFWLYRYMFREKSNSVELLFNQLKLLETALYKVAIFDERLIHTIESKKAEEQSLYLVNEINGYGISASQMGWLSGEFESGELVLKQQSIEKKTLKVNIDILIIHYGLLEKLKDNSKLSDKELKALLFSFPLVVVTSGRGILLDEYRKNKRGHIKFISFPVLKEYFKANSINKIGLTQMLMNLIGIKNNFSGLYDE